MAELTGNVQNQLGIDEHDPKVLAKKVVLWGYDSGTDTSYRLSNDDPLPTGSVSYALRYDEGATYTYIGEATPGTAEATAAWRIKRLTNADNTIVWIDGNSNFDNAWTTRAAGVYS